MKKRLKKVLLVLFLISSVSTLEGRTWTHKKGKQAEAKLYSCKDGIVQLQLPNNKIIKIKKDDLVIEDQLFIDEALKKSRANKASGVDPDSKRADKIKRRATAGPSVPRNYKPSTIAEIPEKKKLENIKQHFMPLWKPDKTTSKVKITSGPTHNVKFPHGNKVGSLWIVQAGKYKVELSIENGSKNSIEDLMDALRCLPDPLLWGLSKGERTGAQIHKSLGAAAYANGHGVLLKQGRWDGLATLLLHEAGHVIYNVTNDLNDDNQEDRWINAMEADDISVSAYGDGRWGEDVAEFGQVYFVCLLAGDKMHFGDRTALEELERLSPQRFAAWQVLLQQPLEYSQPVAAAANQSFKDTDNNGSEMVQLDGSKSKDKDGKIVKYDWYKNGLKIASGISPKVKVPVGAHDIILVVRDNEGYVDDRSFIVTVVDAKSAKAVALDIVAVEASRAPDDHTKEHTIDNKLDTRWSVHGKGHWLQYDLGKAKTVSGVSIAWYSGISRAYSFSVEVSNDGVSWSKAYSGESTKTTNEQEHYRFKPVKARYVKLIGQGSSANAWNNIAEFDAWGTGT